MKDKIEEIVEELFDCGKRYGEDLGYIKDDVLYEYRLSSIGDSKKELSQLITPQEETEKVMLRKIVSASNSILENKEADWRFGFDNCGNLVVIPKRKQ